jgi:hypothetical protein
MNDFLHNLRTKNKRYDGNRRQYPNPQYQDRRNGKDNRKPNQAVNAALEQLSLTISENLPLIKTLLEGISENQKCLAKAEERRAKAEERKAAVMETMIEIAKQWGDGNLNLPDMSKMSFTEISESESEHETKEDDSEILTSTDSSTVIDCPAADSEFSADSTPEPSDTTDDTAIPQELTREEVLDIIDKMRKEGSTYDFIAKHLDSQEIPTFSGKGKWRGQTVHRLYQKMIA